MISSPSLMATAAKLRRVSGELGQRIDSAINWQLYIGRMEQVAAEALVNSGAFDSDESGQIPKLVASIMASSSGDKMAFTLAALKSSNSIDLESITREELVRWVTEEKELTEPRDFYQRDNAEKGRSKGDP